MLPSGHKCPCTKVSEALSENPQLAEEFVRLRGGASLDEVPQALKLLESCFTCEGFSRYTGSALADSAKSKDSSAGTV